MRELFCSLTSNKNNVNKKYRLQLFKQIFLSFSDSNLTREEENTEEPLLSELRLGDREEWTDR